MKPTTLVLLLSLGVIGIIQKGSCKPHDTKTDDYEYHEDDGEEFLEGDDEESAGQSSKIVNKGFNITARAGDTIKLPCNITNREDAVIQWRRGEIPLFFDGRKQIDNDRYSTDQSGITIKDLKAEDEGRFFCILISESQSIDFNVSIRVLPKIQMTVPKHFKKGESVKLNCKATGIPEPLVMWIHRRKHSESIVSDNGVLVIHNLVSKNNGEYICVARNSEGEAKEGFHIDIGHEPEIRTPEESVNTGEGRVTELKCIIHAKPEAKVTWLKDDRVIQTERSAFAHYTATIEGNVYILKIEKTKKSDFGSFTCSARNNNGIANKTISVTGAPSKPVFFSTTIADDNQSSLLTWQVVSFEPLEEFELLYKKQEDDNWNTSSAHPDISTGMEDSLFTTKHKMSDLDPGTYQAKLRVRNKHGWSQMSDVKTFAGHAIGEGAAMQSKLLESSMKGNGANNLEMRISFIFLLALVAARLLN